MASPDLNEPATRGDSAIEYEQCEGEALATFDEDIEKATMAQDRPGPYRSVLSRQTAN